MSHPDPSSVISVEKKGPILAFILALVFGPLGFLYVSILGGIVLMVLCAIVFVLTDGMVSGLVPIGNVVLAITAFVLALSRNRSALLRAAALLDPIRPGR